MKYKPFVYYNKPWNKMCFGVDRLFSISIFKNGVIVDVCYVGTILKKVSYCLSFWNIQVTNY